MYNIFFLPTLFKEESSSYYPPCGSMSYFMLPFFLCSFLSLSAAKKPHRPPRRIPRYLILEREIVCFDSDQQKQALLETIKLRMAHNTPITTRAVVNAARLSDKNSLLILDTLFDHLSGAMRREALEIAFDKNNINTVTFLLEKGVHPQIVLQRIITNPKTDAALFDLAIRKIWFRELLYKREKGEQVLLILNRYGKEIGRITLDRTREKDALAIRLPSEIIGEILRYVLPTFLDKSARPATLLPLPPPHSPSRPCCTLL